MDINPLLVHMRAMVASGVWDIRMTLGGCCCLAAILVVSSERYSGKSSLVVGLALELRTGVSRSGT